MQDHSQRGFVRRCLGIKERFGRMRIYASNGTLETDRLIRYAQEVSLGRCEMCGTTEEATTEVRGWIRTLCRACRAK
jgi:hypothetical protein